MSERSKSKRGVWEKKGGPIRFGGSSSKGKHRWRTLLDLGGGCRNKGNQKSWGPPVGGRIVRRVKNHVKVNAGMGKGIQGVGNFNAL